MIGLLDRSRSHIYNCIVYVNCIWHKSGLFHNGSTVTICSYGKYYLERTTEVMGSAEEKWTYVNWGLSKSSMVR